MQILCSILSRIFNKPVELELIRLYRPYFDSNILVNTIGLISNKIKFRKILKKLFRKATIRNNKKTNSNINLKKPTRSRYSNRISLSGTDLLPSFLSGIQIRVAGRLLTNRVIPRMTVKNYQKGRLARSKATLVDTSRFTRKNKRGTFSITVSTGHIIQ